MTVIASAKELKRLTLRKKKAIAMISQFGHATFFITLSAAKTKLLKLLVILSKTVGSIDISEEEKFSISFSLKSSIDT